jgi:hypothetical protein
MKAVHDDEVKPEADRKLSCIPNLPQLCKDSDLHACLELSHLNIMERPGSLNTIESFEEAEDDSWSGSEYELESVGEPQGWVSTPFWQQ